MLQGKAVARLPWGASRQETHLKFSTATLPSFGQMVYSKIPGTLNFYGCSGISRQLDTKLHNGFIVCYRGKEIVSSG